MRKLILLIVIAIAVIGALVFMDFSQDAKTLPANTAEKVADEEVRPRELSISIYPEIILQGDPALIIIEGATSTSNIKSLTFDNRTLGVFLNDGKVGAIVGVDLRGRIGSHPVVLTLTDGRVIKKDLIVGERVIAKAPLGIPEKLGGNTPQSEQNLISTLVQEGALISAVISGKEKLWDGTFRFPVDPPITITDVYGYSRLTGASTISHKGTDFRASVGTSIYASNSGVVKFTDNLRNYGHTVIIDHGSGILTIYMHLSEVLVKVGDKVQKSQLIAKSGETGYVLGPHLHLTVRINGISIDPMKFMVLVGEG